MGGGGKDGKGRMELHGNLKDLCHPSYPTGRNDEKAIVQFKSYLFSYSYLQLSLLSVCQVYDSKEKVHTR